MTISMDYSQSELRLMEAMALAISDAKLPVIWKSHSKAIFNLDAKTWTPAFATMLLAKATNEHVDTLSLKVDSENPRSYSARGLCHRVLVPAAERYGFSIRNTGREPMNNQPFFRYDRIDKIDRVRNPADREYFFEVAAQASALTSSDALPALAAFLRVALAVTAASRSVVVKGEGLSSNGARVAVGDFLRFGADDRPQRLQAFAAACLDLIFEDVKTRRINDPSRDLPGDVHVAIGTAIFLAVEVKGKPVSDSDLGAFARACETRGVQRAVMLVDSPRQADLQQQAAVINQTTSSLQVSVFASAAGLLAASLLWSKLPLALTIETFVERFLIRLREIEVSLPTLQEWERAVAVAQNK